jgi:2-oxoacid:acceptor oxidoreductase gamma subunit (pyruvate/2-ketoisovalerate family)
MKEIRWHARAGQGAKTAAQLLAVALLREGKSVQAFPEYGPERRGSPMRAYTRYDDRPIRRRDSIEEPDAVVVLEPSLAHDAGVAAGLRPGGLLLVNSEEALPGAICVPAGRIAPDAVNLVMLGALAARLGEPALGALAAAATEVLGRKADPAKLAAALESGHRAAREERWAA